MDFGGWVQNPNVTPGGGQGQAETDRGAAVPPPPPTPPNGGGSGSGDPGTSFFSHQVEHVGVVCDACNNAIFGFRYKCLKCADFDLCSACERRGLHAGHLMIRIPFPEMASEAIRRHMPSVGSPETPFPFGQYDRENRHPRWGWNGGHEHHHRSDQCRGRGTRRRHSHSSPESSDEAKTPAWCPYQMGRKEWKKWAKTLKKTSAKVHKEMAQAHKRTAGGDTTADGTQSTAANGAASNLFPMDFTAAASQIQEFLNAFGVPIDVVELYDEWGNRGAPTNAAPSANPATTTGGTASANPAAQNTATAPNTGATTDKCSATGSVADGSSGTKQNIPASKTDKGITEQFQDMSIRNESPQVVVVKDRNGEDLIQLSSSSSGTARTPEAEGDSEWTLVDNNSSTAHSNNIATPNSSYPGSGDQFPSAPSVDNVGEGETKIQGHVPTGSDAGTSNQMVGAAQYPKLPIDPHPTTGSTGSSRQQPPPPVVAPIVSGLASKLENMAQNISTLAWAPHQPRAPPPQQGPPVLNEQMSYVLNQLLSMGFTNHSGDLSRLVVAKNGNLEEVLNALFPPSSN